MKYTESSLAEYILNEGINENNWKMVKFEFQKIWNYERIKNMRLEEYNDLKDNFDEWKYSFTYWIEHLLKWLGRLWANSPMYKIYKSKEDGLYRYNMNHFLNGQEALEYVKANILKIIDLVRAKDFKSIHWIDLANNFKWKIAFLYDNSDFIIPIYGISMINSIPGFAEIRTNYDAYCKINNELFEHDPYCTHLKLIDELYQYDYKGIETIFIPVKYYLNANENIFDSMEETLKDNKTLSWWIYSSELFEAVSKVKYVFFISALSDKTLILYKANIVKYSWSHDTNIFNTWNHRKWEDLKVIIEIDKIEPVTLSYLEYFLEVTNKRSIRYNIESLMKKECFYWMLNEDLWWLANKYDLSTFDKPWIFSRVDQLMWIQIYDYEWVKNIFLNFSEFWISDTNNQEFLTKSPFDKNIPIANIFHDDWIDWLKCILWKNWVWKSRILKLFCRYLYEWQSNVNSKPDLGKRVEFYFKDKNWNILKAWMWEYIWEQLESNMNYHWKLILDFSQIRHTFIASTLNWAKDFPRNDIFYSQEYSKFRNLTYFYAGIDRITPWYRRQDSNDNLYLLFLILIDSELRDMITEISKEAQLNFIFSQFQFSLKKWAIPKKAKINTLLNLLIYIRDLDKWASFFQENKNRLKLANILKESFAYTSAWTRYTSQVREVEEQVLFWISLEENSHYFDFFKKIQLNDVLPLEYVSNLNTFRNKNPGDNRVNLLLRQLWFLLFNANLIELNLIGDNDKWLWVLSTWEFTLLLTIVKSILSMDQLSEKTTYLIFDEPDLSLHPEWQRRFIDILTIITTKINSLRSRFEKQKIYIIITTHSPIIVSDIPRDNIIWLEIQWWEIKIGVLEEESFLNDIYSNLSSSFFMDQNIWAYWYKKLKLAIERKDRDFSDFIWDEIIKSSFINKLEKNEKNRHN